MKKLGELKPGDYIYVVYYNDEGDCILNVFKRVIRIITDVSTGRIIKWDAYKDSYLDNQYYSHIVRKVKYNDCIDTNHTFGRKICSDKNYVLDLIEKDRQKQMEKYDKILKSL